MHHSILPEVSVRAVPAVAAATTAILGTLVALPALAQPMHDWGWHGHGGFGLGPLFWILVLAAIAWVVVRRRRMPWIDVPYGTQGAMNILRQRYAKGEISAEEFDERRKKLAE